MLDDGGSYLVTDLFKRNFCGREAVTRLVTNRDNVGVSPSTIIEVAANTVIHKIPFQGEFGSVSQRHDRQVFVLPGKSRQSWPLVACRVILVFNGGNRQVDWPIGASAATGVSIHAPSNDSVAFRPNYESNDSGYTGFSS